MLDAQAALAGPAVARPLLLKVGIHDGPCLAVTLNERLDYFGSTVNAAARIVGLSGGHDVVVSGTVPGRPRGGREARRRRHPTEPLDAALKGFDDAPFELWRVRRAG